MSAIPGYGYVQPSSYLRPRGQTQAMSPSKTESAVDRDQRIGLVCTPSYYFRTANPATWKAMANVLWSLQQRIRDFLKVRTSYDVLPLSFRLIIFDTSLLVKKSLTILVQNGELADSALEQSGVADRLA